MFRKIIPSALFICSLFNQTVQAETYAFSLDLPFQSDLEKQSWERGQEKDPTDTQIIIDTPEGWTLYDIVVRGSMALCRIELRSNTRIRIQHEQYVADMLVQFFKRLFNLNYSTLASISINETNINMAFIDRASQHAPRNFPHTVAYLINLYNFFQKMMPYNNIRWEPTAKLNHDFAYFLPQPWKNLKVFNWYIGFTSIYPYEQPPFSPFQLPTYEARDQFGFPGYGRSEDYQPSNEFAILLMTAALLTRESSSPPAGED